MTYHLSITKYRDDPYQIAIYETRHDLMMGHRADYYQAKNAEELLVFLMGVYDWYPEGHEFYDALERLSEGAEFCQHLAPNIKYGPIAYCRDCLRPIEAPILTGQSNNLGRKNEKLEVRVLR